MDRNNFLHTFTEMMLPFLSLLRPLPPEIFIVAYVQVTCHMEGHQDHKCLGLPWVLCVSPKFIYWNPKTPVDSVLGGRANGR